MPVFAPRPCHCRLVLPEADAYLTDPVSSLLLNRKRRVSDAQSSSQSYFGRHHAGWPCRYFLCRSLPRARAIAGWYCPRLTHTLRTLFLHCFLTEKGESLMHKVARNLILAATMLAGLVGTSYAGLCPAPVPLPAGIARG